MKKVTKGFDVGFKALDNSDEVLTITGKASTFGNPDQVGDIIERGAFTETINEHERRRASRGDKTLVPMLMNHDAWSHSALPVGSVVELKQTDHDLLMRAELDKQLPDTAKIGRLVQSGAISGLSIGFFIQEQDRTGDNRRISKIKLQEVSLTPFPCNEEATILGAKDALSLTLEHMLSLNKRDLEAMLRDGVPFSRSGAKQFLSFLDTLREAAKSEDLRDADQGDIKSRPLTEDLAALMKQLTGA